MKINIDDLIREADEVEKTLTGPEKHVIDYHRKNMGLNIKHPKTGRPMTAYMVGPKMRRGNYEGMVASVPGFVPGHNSNNPMSEDQAHDYWFDEIEKGVWPIYDEKTANTRSKEVHKIMDSDTLKAMRDKRGNKKD